MQTKRKTGIAVQHDRAAGTITWHDREGKEADIVVHVDQLAEAIRDDGLYHGIDQKVTDAGAMGNDYWDGKDKPKRYGTIAERMTRMRRVADGLGQGLWFTKRSSDPLSKLSVEELKVLEQQVLARLAALRGADAPEEGAAAE